MNDVAKSGKRQKISVDGVIAPVVEQNQSKLPKNKWIIRAVVAVIVVAAIGSSVFFYSKYQDVKSNPVQAVEQKNTEETQRVLTALKKTLLINDTESPTVARIEDPEKLKSTNPEFYKDIQQGDYLVIYPKRAIVYRESNDQLINVAPIVDVNNLQQATTPATESTEANQ